MASPAKLSPEPGFTRLIPIEPLLPSVALAAQVSSLYRELEIGNILFFPKSPIDISEAHRQLLTGLRGPTFTFHKNVAYRPSEDRLTGVDSASSQFAYIREILCNFSNHSVDFLSRAMSLYANSWTLDYASYRPIEERGRRNRLHARNDLLHFDSFPTRPTNGARILRFFVNINPSRDRVWVTSQTFEFCAIQFVRRAWLRSAFPSPLTRRSRSLLHFFGIRGAVRPAYDELMHRCHNAMKEDIAYQTNTPKFVWRFPPGSAWMVFTDCVSHSVLSGQYALEQTFFIPQSALTEPQHSPLAVLEGWAGRSLTE